jgi:hypothetical protein
MMLNWPVVESRCLMEVEELKITWGKMLSESGTKARLGLTRQPETLVQGQTS